MQEAAPFLGSAVQSHQHRPELTAPRCSSDYSFSPQLTLYAGNRHVSELKGLLSSCLWTWVIPGQRGAATAWGHCGDTGQGRWRSWGQSWPRCFLKNFQISTGTGGQRRGWGTQQGSHKPNSEPWSWEGPVPAPLSRNPPWLLGHGAELCQAAPAAAAAVQQLLSL